MKARNPQPTTAQSQLLSEIAHSPLIKTYSSNHKVIWGLANGKQIPEKIAKTLILNGWVKPERDGLGLFEESQTYSALKPGG